MTDRSTFFEYKIQKGDTLGKIAKQLGIKDYKALAELNGIKNADLIFEGDTLKIPSQHAGAAIAAPVVSTLEPMVVKAPETSVQPVNPPPVAMPGSIAQVPEPSKPAASDAVAITNLREQIVRHAAAELGTMETGKDNVGEKLTEYRQYTNNPNGAAWCADFTSYVLEGVQHGLIKPTGVAGSLLEQFRKSDAFYSVKAGKTPQPGDLIFFTRDNPKVKGDEWQRHVGVVKAVDENGVIHTIEGNKADPKFRGNPNYKWSQETPDGVRAVSYTPEQLAQEGYLGIGSIEDLVHNKGVRLAASITNPQQSNIVAATEKSSTGVAMNASVVMTALGMFLR